LISSFLGFYSYSNLIGDIFVNKNNVGFLYNFSDISINKIEHDNDNPFMVYQGYIKNSIYFESDLILPSNAIYEFDSIFINLEGRYRLAKQSIKSFSGIYSD
jgi:NADH dehydrogenase/NADH:ubiquinone oxidoreductase subunit G